MKSGFFKVDRYDVSTSEGTISLPILYYDVSVFQAFFLVDRERAEEKLRGTGLRPVLLGGRAFAGLAFFEYRQTSIGPYNEVGTVLAVYPDRESSQPKTLFDILRPSAERKNGFHILDLPVTTAGACAAGRELWGFPKFVTDIPLTFEGRRFSGSVLDPDRRTPILTLDGRYGRGPRLPGIDLVLYSLRSEEMLRTVVTTDSRMTTSTGRGLALTLGDSDHPMARNLRDLELDGRRPIVVQNAEYFRSRLPAGEPITATALRRT